MGFMSCSDRYSDRSRSFGLLTWVFPQRLRRRASFPFHHVDGLSRGVEIDFIEMMAQRTERAMLQHSAQFANPAFADKYRIMHGGVTEARAALAIQTDRKIGNGPAVATPLERV